MKLVDILARELKEWPGCEEIFQDYDGELRYIGHPVSTRSGCFVETCDDMIRPKYGCHIKGVTRNQWQEARDALLKAESKEWNGEGLPPVGTVCELRARGGGWGKAEIKYHGRAVCVWLWLRDDVKVEQIEHALCPDSMEFRPIRTPEQIAAEERRRGISEISKILHSGASTLEEDAATLWDLGWRKQEPK